METLSQTTMILMLVSYIFGMITSVMLLRS